jgi:hypothetical protein
VDAVRDFVNGLKSGGPLKGRTKQYAGEITRSLNTIDKRLTAERARAARKLMRLSSPPAAHWARRSTPAWRNWRRHEPAGSRRHGPGWREGTRLRPLW